LTAGTAYTGLWAVSSIDVVNGPSSAVTANSFTTTGTSPVDRTTFALSI
jgi:hypothetical protein